MDLINWFAKSKEIVPIPIEQRSRRELLELLETNKVHLQQAQLVLTPVVCWDGGEGSEETEIIELLGMFIVPFEGVLRVCVTFSPLFWH